MLHRSSVFAVAALLVAASGCDLLFGPPPAVIGGGRRSEGEAEGEGEEGEGEEGEGEGEPDLPPDIRPDPQGPNIQSIALSTSRLDDRSVANLTVVVTDVDGAGDIIGPLLIEPVSGRTIGTLASPAAGTFTASISWDTWSDIDPIEFVRGGSARFIRVQFSDNAGHQVTATERIEVFCQGGLPACANQCGAVLCQGECVNAPEVPSAADLCGGCNLGCTANAGAGAACFNPSPSCGGGADCLLGFTTNGSQIDSSTCQQNGGVTLREDGIVVWSVGSGSLPVNFLFDSNHRQTLGTTLCASFGGLDFATSTSTIPAGVSSSLMVVDVENPSCLSNPSTCEPVTGTAAAFGSPQALQLLCNNPLSPDQGTFGHACFNGSCTDGSSCDDFNCVEFCGSPADCDVCAAGGDSCVCNGSGLCELAFDDPNQGGFGQPCVGGTFGTCDRSDLFCDAGTCKEDCFSPSDCDLCAASGGSSCTCDGSGVCQAGGGGGSNFTCVAASGRTLNAAGTFNGSTAGKSDTQFGSCQPTDGPDEFWKFTPPTTGLWTVRVTAAFDTVLVIRSECGGSELECDDDGATTNNNSLLSISLTRNVPVLIAVDGFNSASGSYTLTLTAP